ncbi:MAG: amino acid--tRNA ligase-related protein, partial [Gammaproteobacteria bacterium]
PLEQRERFLKDIEVRKQKQLPVAPLDEHFLAALEHGLPECAGVAVGLDRLLMVLSGSDDIHDMHTFTLKNN